MRLLDLGPQPPSNRFVGAGVDDADRHPLVLGQCASCGLVQLIQPMSVDMVKSRFSWLAYNEPEGHLDALVNHVLAMPGIQPRTRIMGMTYKDDSTLARFSRLGFGQTTRLDPKSDLGIDDAQAGLETIQSVLDPTLTLRLAAKHGKANILIARHIVEHAHAPGRFLDALCELLADDGILILEMPDCSKFLRSRDYSFIWEEHICYFSPDTMRDFAARHGLQAAEKLLYSYPLEDSLVVILRHGSGRGGASHVAEVQRMAEAFSAGFAQEKAKVRARLAALRSEGIRIAVFGAGHLAAKYINLFELADLVDCVVDDNADKQGMLMPGSHLPIVGSAALFDRSIGLCLLSLSPESEEKVLSRKSDYIERGGRFASIFPLSPLALLPA